MIVGVGGEEMPDGDYLAQVVLMVNKLPKP
jgi:hypothetical protein